MIEGRFGEIGELFFEIDLIANNGEVIPVEGLLDTGFTTGWLAMKIQDVEVLGWTLLQKRRVMQTASGETLFALYEGRVILGEEEFLIPVHARAGVEEVLLGLQWLMTQRLVVDFPQGVLTLDLVKLD